MFGQPQQGSGMPIAQVEINGVALWLLVDTGNAGTILINCRAASKVGLLGKWKAQARHLVPAFWGQ